MVGPHARYSLSLRRLAWLLCFSLGYKIHSPKSTVKIAYVNTLLIPQGKLLLTSRLVKNLGSAGPAWQQEPCICPMMLLVQ